MNKREMKKEKKIKEKEDWSEMWKSERIILAHV